MHGDGLTWTNQVGTFGITGGKAQASAVPAIATVPTGKADVFIGGSITRSAGNVGLVLRYGNASNYMIAYHDGTNAKLDKVVGGVTTNLISTAATYAAGAQIMVWANGNILRLYHNNVFIGQATTSDLAGNAAHGIYSSDANNTIDDWYCFATGTSGEYAYLAETSGVTGTLAGSLAAVTGSISGTHGVAGTMARLLANMTGSVAGAQASPGLQPARWPISSPWLQEG